MNSENIFLDDETYMKRSYPIAKLAELNSSEDTKFIAKHFISIDYNLNEMRDVIKNQM
jgi:hypothetical protein